MTIAGVAKSEKCFVVVVREPFRFGDLVWVKEGEIAYVWGAGICEEVCNVPCRRFSVYK